MIPVENVCSYVRVYPGSFLYLFSSIYIKQGYPLLHKHAPFVGQHGGYKFKLQLENEKYFPQ